MILWSHTMAKKAIKIDSNLLFLIHLPHFIRYLFSWEILPFLIVFSLTFLFLPFSTLVFFFLQLIVLMMVYKLAFDVLVDIAKGNMKPTVKHNYLVTNAVAVKVAMFAVLIEATLMWLKKDGFDDVYRYNFIILSTFITPAVYMSLAITNSMLHALNPINLFKIIKTSYISYLLFVVFWIASIFLHENIINPFLLHYFPVFINGIVSGFIEYSFLLINFQIMGYMIFQNRVEFNLDLITGFNKIDSGFITLEEPEINPYHQRIQNLLAEDEHQLALSMAIELKDKGDDSPELMHLYRKALQKKMHKPNNQEIADKVHWRISKNQLKKAFDIVTGHLDAEKEFKEKSAGDINRLVVHAIEINKTEYVAQLVKDFDIKHPNHPDIVINYFLLAKVIYRVRSERGKSKKIIENIISKYPYDVHIEEIKAWYKGIKLISNNSRNL